MRGAAFGAASLVWTLSCVGCGRLGIELLPLELVDDDGPSLHEEPDGDDAGTDGENGGEGDGDSDGGPGDDGPDNGGPTSDGGSQGPCALDDDDDGVNNCEDGCPLDPDKTELSECGDECDPASYVSDATCGVGYCQTHNTPSSCINGYEAVCVPGSPRATDDTTADGVDDDCDGEVDENACTPHSETFGAGQHTSTPGPCKSATITLWGGGGASGSANGGYWGGVKAGAGGAGGYVQATVSVTASSVLNLYVGTGGQGCGGAGTGPDAAQNGGAGATSRSGNGAAGAGSTAGGAGGSGGGKGAVGNHGGGGGGGGGGPAWNPYGNAGGGGAATLVVVGGTSLLAGGGGGGGGSGSTIASSGEAGGSGGSGCGVKGANGSGSGGGGGGGGTCLGATTSAGTARTPFDPSGVLPVGTALGGDNATDCAKGGDGYVIITYGP